MASVTSGVTMHQEQVGFKYTRFKLLERPG